MAAYADPRCQNHPWLHTDGDEWCRCQPKEAPHPKGKSACIMHESKSDNYVYGTATIEGGIELGSDASRYATLFDSANPFANAFGSLCTRRRRRLAAAPDAHAEGDYYCDDNECTDRCMLPGSYVFACDAEDNRVCESPARVLGYPEDYCDDAYCGQDGVENWQGHCEDKYCEGVPTVAVMIGNLLTVIPLAALSLTKRCAARLLN